MVVSFDKFGKYEAPTMILCDPGSVLSNGVPTMSHGEIPFVTDLETVFSFNEMSEINFRTYYVPTNQNGWLKDDAASFVSGIFNKLEKYRYIYLVGYGYFRIADVKDTTQDATRTKDVRAVSCDVELTKTLLPYIQNGTYPITGHNNDTGMDGIIGLAISNAPFWSVGHIDEDLLTLNRTFNDVDATKDVYTFLTEDIQEAFECIVLFDINERVVDVYSKSNVTVDTNIHLAREDLIEMLEISEPSDGPYTGYRVFGEDAISISAVNPIGGNVIYNFDNYLSWMPDTLKQKVINWEQAVADIESSYMSISLEYFTLSENLTNLMAEIDRINICKEIYQKCYSNVQATSSSVPGVQCNDEIAKYGESPISLTAYAEDLLSALSVRISEKEADLAAAVAAYDELEATVAAKKAERDQMYNSVSFDTYFTASEYAILSSYMFEKSHTDTYLALDNNVDISAKLINLHIIYDRAKKELSDAAIPLKQYAITTESFIFEERFLPWAEQLNTGCAINVETGDYIVEKIFLSKIEVNYEDRSTRFTFGNKIEKTGRKSLFDDLFENVVTKEVVERSDENYVDNDIYIVTQDGAFLTTDTNKYLVCKE